jgi:hypothetical protein
MTLMFWKSSIVDCGIGEWDVTAAKTDNMLANTDLLAAFRKLTLPKWPKAKIDDAKVPEKNYRLTFVSRSEPRFRSTENSRGLWRARIGSAHVAVALESLVRFCEPGLA